MNKFLKIFFALTVSGIILSGCDSHSTRVRRLKIDREAYKLGEEHGEAVIVLQGDTTALCNRLLDVRTRESDLRHRFGDDTADSYISGFEDYIEEHDRALAEKLF